MFSQGFFGHEERFRMSRNYLHNNRNGVSLRGVDSVWCYNVLWMNPNHGILAEENSDRAAESSVTFEHNLIVDTQEGAFLYGGANYVFRHNTWYDRGDQECGIGTSLLLLDRTPTGPAPSENLPIMGPFRFLSNFAGVHEADPRHFMRIEVEPSIIAESDYNMLFVPSGMPDQWVRRNFPEAAERNWQLAEWQSEMGLDANSTITSSDPQFADPSIYPVPTSWSDAWERFRPAATSPLCGAAADGSDVGAVPCAE